MRAPNKVKIGGHIFSIKYFETTDPSREFGSYQASANRIELQKGLSAHQERATLLHEILHGICYGSGLSGKLGKALEEDVVIAFESNLYQVIRDNPKLIKYLTERVNDD